MDTPPEFLRPLYEMEPPFPRAALAEAVRRREESTPCLLRSIERAAGIEEDGDDDAWAELDSLHIYALYLLAQFRETRAYEPIVRLFRNPSFEELTGDVAFEGLPRILASVCGGDLGPVKALFEDSTIDEAIRSAALDSLGVLVNAGLLPREELSRYIGAFFATGRTEETTDFLVYIAIGLCADHRLAEHLDTIRALYREDDGLSRFDSLENVEKRLALPPGESMYPGAGPRPRGLIDSAIDELEDWWCFDPRSLEEEAEDARRFEGDLPIPPGYSETYPSSGTYVRESPKIGRNDSCPCGSGRKFKKCCGAAA